MKQAVVGFLMGLMGMASVAVAQTEGEPAGPWTLCNETSFILHAATAVDGEDKMTSTGSVRLHPGECRETGITTSQPRFVYAESVPAHLGGIREWKGGAQLCVGEGDVAFDPEKTCEEQSLTSRGFFPVSDAEQTTRFTEPENFGSRAETAGLQRLLRDNGYKITRVDGVAGRRTSRTLGQFLKDKGLAANAPRPDVFRALETHALSYAETVGLRVCNNSTRTIWAAIAQRQKENWRSSGWWEIDAKACAKPVTAPVNKTDIHVYARQAPEGADGEDLPLIVKNTTPSYFCVAEARFSALGRENCRDQGYDRAVFRALPNDKIGLTVTLTDGDFNPDSATGLRR